jgi:methanogenic corrinoid protein MtbC1
MNHSPLVEALAALNEDEVIKLVRAKIDAGIEPLSIVRELQNGMDVFGERCKKGEYFIAELIVSGEIFQQSMKILEPLLQSDSDTDGKIKMVLGTVKGDIHNLGKDILAVLLKAAGFAVYDLGINVPPTSFVDQLKKTDAPLLGLSGLITPSFESMKETVKAVEAAGLRNKVKVIIGGGVVDKLVRDYTGADAFSRDAIEGVELCKRLVRGEVL